MKIVRKFRYAIEGVFYLVSKDRNFQIHLLLFFILVSFGFFFTINPTEWSLILICSALVLTLEAINSSTEKLANLISTEIHPEIKKIKDIAAGAVLVASLFSIAIALIVFAPKIWHYLFS